MGKKSKRVRGGGGCPSQAGRRQQQQQQQQQPAPFIDLASYERHGGNGQLLETREQLDFSMQRFATLPLSNPWNEDRSMSLYTYYLICKDLFDMQVQWIKQQGLGTAIFNPLTINADFKFLQKIAKNTQMEPVFFRSLALIILGVVYFTSRDAQGEALESFDDAFAAIDSLSDTEKKRTVRIKIDVQTTVGASLTQLKEHFVGIIKGLDACRIFSWSPTGAAYMPVAVMAGLHCDCCSEPRGESVFMVCERCQLAHYCSLQCQRKAWKYHGHKVVCRKKGEFRVGDAAGMIDPFGIVGFCHLVRLKAPAVHDDDDDDDNHSSQSWQVESTLEDDVNGVKLVKTMSAVSLIRVRPGLWNIMTSDEWETVRENMDGDDDSNVPSLTAR